MRHENYFRKVRIFVASPTDVAAERKRLRDVVNALGGPGNIAEFLGFSLDLLDWQQDVVPGSGLPEDVTLTQWPVDAWDIFIGILWLRFGTPTGSSDPSRPEGFGSGTEEEFTRAYQSWEQTKRPKIMFYRCGRDARLTELDGAQFERVKVFFQQFDANAKHPGVYRPFTTLEDFEHKVQEDLTKLLIEVFCDDLQNRFGVRVSRGDVMRQLEDAWARESLLAEAMELTLSERPIGQLRRQDLLQRLTRILGDAQAILVDAGSSPEGWCVGATVNVLEVPTEIDMRSGLLVQLALEDTNYIEFPPDGRTAQDPFYRVFDARRTVENFPVWRGGQLKGFVAFASNPPVSDQLQPRMRLVKIAVRALVGLGH